MINRVAAFVLSLGLVALIASPAAWGHASHSHGELADVSDAAWRAQLTAFREYGQAESLELAKRIAKVRVSQDDTDTLYLLARTAQADHRFGEALDYLERLLQKRRQHTAALLLVASVERAQGNAVNAQQACNRLQDVALLMLVACKAQAQNQANPRTLAILERLVAATAVEPQTQATLAWALAITADEAAQLNKKTLALEYYRAAHQLSPSVRVLAAMVDMLVALDRSQEALALIPSAPEALSLQVKQLALLRGFDQLASNDQRKLRLGAQFATDRRAGDFTHGREMAEFYLDVLQDAKAARAVIDRYILNQREVEDLRLRRRAAQNTPGAT